MAKVERGPSARDARREPLVIYFDTSFLVPLFLEEPISAAVEAFISGLPIGELATSQ